MNTNSISVQLGTETSLSARMETEASLSAGLATEASFAGQLGTGAAVVNDYLIRTEEIEDGHRLTITRGSEVQSIDVMNGTKGEPGQDAPQESVLYTPQTLTEAQQAQARENISAADAERVAKLADGLAAAEEGTSVLREKPELQPVYQAADYHQESGIREFYYDADRDCLIAKYDNPTTGGEIATSATANLAGITSENGIFECAGKVIRLEYEIDVQDDAEPYFAIRIYAAADGSGSSYRLTRVLAKDKNSLLYDIEAEIAAFGKDPAVFKYYYFEGVSSNVFTSSRRNCVRLYYYGEYSPEQMDAGINLKEKVGAMRNSIPAGCVLSEVSNVLDFRNADGNSLYSVDLSAIAKKQATSESILAHRSRIQEYFFAVSDSDYSDEYLNDCIARVPNGKHYAFVTDMHYPRNAHHSADILSYVSKKLDLSYVLNGGDNIDQHATRYEAYGTHRKCLGEFVDEFGDRFLSCVGNHDNNSATGDEESARAALIPWTKLQPVINGHLGANCVRNDQSERLRNLPTALTEEQFAELDAYFKCSYYLDDSVVRTRFIAVNTGNPYGVQYDVFGVSGTAEIRLHYDWIINTLLTTPEGYDVVVLGHAFDGTGNSGSWQLTTAEYYVANFMSAVKRKLPGYGFNLGNESSGNDNYDYWFAPGAHFYPCDGANDIGNAFVLSGNSHHDVIFINTPRESQPNLCDSSVYDGGAIDQGAGQIPIIVTQCDAYAAAADSVHSTAMTKDTVSEVCIDLVTTNETGVYLTRIGAGSDREILFSQKDS